MKGEASGTLYLATNGQQHLDQAQQTIEQHLRISVGGRCLACGCVPPCPALATANGLFARYGRLPRRTPGATVPDFLRRVS